jgi:hypothetical protein
MENPDSLSPKDKTFYELFGLFFKNKNARDI